MPTKTRKNEGRQKVEKGYFTEAELAAYLAVSMKWLQKCRLDGVGIPYHKFGSVIRYAVDNVREYERACLRTSTSDAGPQ